MTSAYYPDKGTAFKTGVVPRKPDKDELIERRRLRTGDAWYFKDRHGAIQGPFRSGRCVSGTSPGISKASLQVRKAMDRCQVHVPQRAILDYRKRYCQRCAFDCPLNRRPGQGNFIVKGCCGAKASRRNAAITIGKAKRLI